MVQQAQHSKKVTGKKITENKSLQKISAAKYERTQDIAPEHRRRLIAEEAYCIAEKRNFEGDMALSDWLQAEMDLDARLFAERH